ncbi:arginine--tRNA ligase, partial [Candidatus Shapirobacteria bacterium RBG_13_44_7]
MELIKRWLKEATGVETEVEHPTDGQFGDYATNVAMMLAKKTEKNPREVAGEIKEKLEKIIDESVVEKVEVAGAGFINFYLKKEYLVSMVEKINYEIEFKKELGKYGQGKTVVVDYSSPNIAKPFGIGHLRSTNIGQAIYNIYKILGWKCIGDNHLGDWGTQFGK